MNEPGFGKTESWTQARAIGLTLYGFAVLLIDPPGKWLETSFNGERASMGNTNDPALMAGAPAIGVYAWDLMRAMDYASSRTEIDITQVAIEGFGYSGVAATLAYVFEPRIKACVTLASAGSMETMPHTGLNLLNAVYLNSVGDMAHLLALRAPAPIFLGGLNHDTITNSDSLHKTYEKLQKLYRQHNKEAALRLEIIDSPVDYSRRVREAEYAFLLEHLKGEPRRSYAPELRPMTDGATNPHECGTEPTHAEDLWVTPEWQRHSKSLREILDQAMMEPYPNDYVVEERLAPWARYGRWEIKVSGQVLRIHDPGEPGSQDSIQLPLYDVDPALCLAQGISTAEFFAQLLHLTVPGGPEGWEARAHGADALTAMFTSVKTLVGGGSDQQPITSIEALGPVASQAARFFKILRPNVELRISHELHGWNEIVSSGNPHLLQPGARYMKWPF